ncbi:hypothetical protein, partial [Pseudomonas putida]|uniref:hypothetical protein n=1 Tax=Pseudomonas putida TaxID=303 RepID=UPI001E4F04BE
WVAGSAWNRWSDAHGMGGQMTVESAGSDQKWTQIGFGNAVNRRGDGKAVYFDEVLFNVDNQIIKAKVTKHVDEEMHRKLGFLEQRKEREKSVASPKPEALTEPVKQQPSPAQPTVKSRARA